jgi:GTP cyclohydrolase IA
MNELQAKMNLMEYIRGILNVVDSNPARSGIQETPERAAKAWMQWTSGYDTDVDALFKVFDDGAEDYDEMVILKDYHFYSHCEHHLAPFFGTATIAYIPQKRNPKIVGISKLGRVTDAYARRLQTQERITQQIANAIQRNLDPLGVGVILRGRHFCMESRGVQRYGQEMITSKLLGAMREGSARTEFMSLAS